MTANFGSVLNGFNSNNSYFISGDRYERQQLEQLFTLLANGTENGQEQFAIIREIANSYLRQREFGRLINFLGAQINEDPDNYFNTYYLFMIAFAYQQLEAFPVAALFLDMIVKNFPDLIVQGRSIHLAALNELINLVENPQQRIWYLEELISRFQDQIDPGPAFFMLGQAFEGAGEWGNAIRAYTQFLAHAGTNVPGFPNAESYARQLVNFYNSARDWTFESLDALASAVKEAINAGSPARLWRYHAKANFFTRTWEHNESLEGVAGHFVFNLSDFMRGNRIRHAANVESVNANEAYLRTWGWSLHISTWYLYFRRVHFPLDPYVHGRWEWAGIFYGERF